MRRLVIVSLVFLLLLTASPLLLSAQDADPFATQTYHIVRPGDTLYSIARLYGVSAEAIAAVNNIYNFNLIYVGQTLAIPSPSQPPPPTYITYTVRAGDTLARIARSYGTTVGVLAQLNGINNINRIYVGQRLLVPSGGYYPPDPTVITYHVRYGDTLGRIARYYGVSIQSIVSYNGIANPNRIYAGMVLYIPLYW